MFSQFKFNPNAKTFLNPAVDAFIPSEETHQDKIRESIIQADKQGNLNETLETVTQDLGGDNNAVSSMINAFFHHSVAKIDPHYEIGVHIVKLFADKENVFAQTFLQHEAGQYLDLQPSVEEQKDEANVLVNQQLIKAIQERNNAKLRDNIIQADMLDKLDEALESVYQKYEESSVTGILIDAFFQDANAKTVDPKHELGLAVIRFFANKGDNLATIFLKQEADKYLEKKDEATSQDKANFLNLLLWKKANAQTNLLNKLFFTNDVVLTDEDCKLLRSMKRNESFWRRMHDKFTQGQGVLFLQTFQQCGAYDILFAPLTPESMEHHRKNDMWFEEQIAMLDRQFDQGLERADASFIASLLLVKELSTHSTEEEAREICDRYQLPKLSLEDPDIKKQLNDKLGKFESEVEEVYVSHYSPGCR